jgi:hypothetical protein
MGPWDIMSEHFVKRDESPPGISSFTKIRLGWISPQQVLLTKPGETIYSFLSPLSQKGSLMAVKIPLKGDRYYLLENRQPIGFDSVLPDAGLLVLKVDPNSPEGYGTVKVPNADKNSPHFSRATFRLDQNNRNIFIDKEANVAIIPLWTEGENLGVLITTPEKSNEALKAALMIQKLKNRYPEPRGREENQLIENCVACFKRYDFITCYQLAQKVMKD